MFLTGLNMDSFVDELFQASRLDERNSIILRKRFGLDTPETDTLQALGNKYSITRERIRQLENHALGEIKKSIDNFEIVMILKEYADKHLSSVGGVRKDDIFIDELYSLLRPTKDKDVFGNQTRFVFKILEFPYFAGEDDTFYSFWYSDEQSMQKMKIIHDAVAKNLSSVEQFDNVFYQATTSHDVVESIMASFLSVSKRLGVGPYGDIGLSEWEEINPKTVRAKIFALLKKSQTPMHFTEIANKIGNHSPTVHNELIKDPRFVLTGRGTYGLKS